MVQMIPRLQAEESLRSAYVQRIATAAGGYVSATSKKAIQGAIDDFQRLMKGFQAQALGTDGQEVDAQGRPILRTAQQIRKWFFDEGGLKVG